MTDKDAARDRAGAPERNRSAYPPGAARRFLSRLRRRLGGADQQGLVSRYEARPPSVQTVADIFAGSWKSHLPGIEGTGSVEMFDDARIAWVAGELPGGLAGRSVCEIGPFEGYQTRLLKEHGAGEVISVEANTFNYLKCLCVREIYGFDAQYLLGDGPGYLASCDRRFDLIFASGVLYHMQDPLGFLSAAAARTDHLFLWTHHFLPGLLASGHGQSGHFRPAEDRLADWRGRTVRLHARSRGRTVRLHARSYRIRNYRMNIPAYWEGGQEDLTYWLEREDLLSVLADLGLSRIAIGFEGEMEGGLPVMSLLASRGG